VKKVLRESFVCVAIDCDRPDPAVRALGAANMGHARMLPFIIFTDEEGKFLEGSDGGASASSFLAALERVKKAGRAST
jgi:hypothetical protein